MSEPSIPQDDPPPIRRAGEGWRFETQGWTYLHIQGEAAERGFQHGRLMARELGEILRTLRHVIFFDTGKPWEFFAEAAESLFAHHLDEELAEEIRGIAEGARQEGAAISWQDVLAWNGFEELLGSWWPLATGELGYEKGAQHTKSRCSAFLAHDRATAGGKIVMAHNSWDEFATGQFQNLILDLAPSRGHRILMQAAPGYVVSLADWFLTSAGLLGCETTLDGFSAFDPSGVPAFVRVRRAMQYGERLEDFVEVMQEGNNGGYANSWLVGDVRTDEILRLELGLEFSSLERNPKNGYFIGFNAAYDPRIRNLETTASGFLDVRRHEGARRVRLEKLMREHHGAIDVEIAQQILADHHDVYLEQKGESTVDHPCARTICGHYELDAREWISDPDRPLPFQPRGTLDGKVCDSAMARELEFWARWGTSCGRPFVAEEFLAAHPQWGHLEGFLHDRPARPWVRFGVERVESPAPWPKSAQGL